MYIELFTYVDKDEEDEKGEYLGYVSLEDEEIYIDIDNEELACKLERLFAEPFTYSDRRRGTRMAEPYTRDFFKNVIPHLSELGISGKLRLEADYEKESKKPIIIPEEIEDEEVKTMRKTHEEIEDLQDEDYDEDLEEEEEDEDYDEDEDEDWDDEEEDEDEEDIDEEEDEDWDEEDDEDEEDEEDEEDDEDEDWDEDEDDEDEEDYEEEEEE